MYSKFTNLALTIMISASATQSLASAGQSPVRPVGIYSIEGPTDEIGDKNYIGFANNGDVTLIQESMGQRLKCTGPSETQNGVLKVSGTCNNGRNFEMQIDLNGVSSPTYFRASVLCATIYPKEVEMRFHMLRAY